MKKERLILFTSLPNVGGHSSITLGLCRLLRPYFREILVCCKTMRGHGFSPAAKGQLEEMGCDVVVLSDEGGRTRFLTFLGLLPRLLFGGRAVALVLAMRHLSLLFARLPRRICSVYYHITHDLNPPTLRRLGLCRRFFDRLAFICPATWEEFRALRGEGRSRDSMAWVPQPSEIPVEEPERLVEEREASATGRPFRFGVLGRLTEQKGAAAMLGFAGRCGIPCELRIAGSGPFAEAFRERSEREDLPVVVRFHGAFDPTERAAFLREFFREIDCLVVPSLDEWETLSMAALEALQHGVPALICRTGGLVSFANPSLGPAPESAVRLVDPWRIGEVMEEMADAPRPPVAATARACIDYYRAHFSDERIRDRWLDLLGGDG